MNNPVQKADKKNIAIILMIAIFFIADQAAKAGILRFLGNGRQPLLGDFFSLEFFPNRYISFSLPIGGLGLEIAVALMIAALSYFLIRARRQNYGRLAVWGLILLIAGAAGNLTDRLFRGYVIDYLYLQDFSVFNLADIYISLGAILVLIGVCRKK